MDICIVKGKVISKIEFEFIYKSRKNISIARCRIKLGNGSIVEVVGYNEIAYYMYSKLNICNTVFILGKIILIKNKIIIEIEEIRKEQ